MPSPRAGYAVANVLGGRFDGGRIVPAGMHESFVARAAGATVVVRSDEAIDAIVKTPRGEATLSAPRTDGAWTVATARASIERGDRVEITARAWLRDFHVWILKE
jgi:hypothetical protein